MPATAARIGFIQHEYRRVAATSPSVQTRHGKLARESDDPIETFFDNVADAQTVATERQALLSPDRRRFRTTTVGIEEALSLNYIGQVPVARYIDAKRNANFKAAASEVIMDFDTQRASFMVWG